MANGRTLLALYLPRINAITPPDELDCRNTLVGRTMHFCGEDGKDLPNEVKLQLAMEALEAEQEEERARDRRSPSRGRHEGSRSPVRVRGRRIESG